MFRTKTLLLAALLVLMSAIRIPDLRESPFQCGQHKEPIDCPFNE